MNALVVSRPVERDVAVLQHNDAQASRSARAITRRAVSGCALVALSSLSGCAWTLISAAGAAGSLVQAGVTVASNYSTPDFVIGKRLTVQNVCIEWNPLVSTAGFVPALQLALSRRGVQSTVHNQGTAPAGCESTLAYSAVSDWGAGFASDTYTQYLSTIDLRLIAHGESVTAHYQTASIQMDRFASTSNKLAGLLDKMVVSAAR